MEINKINKMQSMRLRQKWFNVAIAVGSFTFFIENSGIDSTELSCLFLISMVFFIISMVISSYLVILENMTFHNDDVCSSDDEINYKLEESNYEATQNLTIYQKFSAFSFLLAMLFALWNIHGLLASVFVMIIVSSIYLVRKNIKKTLKL